MIQFPVMAPLLCCPQFATREWSRTGLRLETGHSIAARESRDLLGHPPIRFLACLTVISFLVPAAHFGLGELGEKHARRVAKLARHPTRPARGAHRLHHLQLCDRVPGRVKSPSKGTTPTAG